ncbi:MAG TPA: LPS export ABC transporter permease LptF [Gammaproteobacteria bacterium]|jgi:lipopolysaccharide export system permease protein|nr:LPS export ABC transporter permease LptF [Gammaproteobacteria bacterium]
MIRIVDRYLIRETTLTWAAVTGVLMLILMSNRFALLLGDAATGKLPRDTVFILLGLACVSYLIVVIPVSLFLAVMLALGRLYRDSEMTTLMACGIGPRQIYRPLLTLALILALLLALLSLQVAPWAVRTSNIIRSTAQHNAQMGSFESGSFKVDTDGKGVLYATKVSNDGRALDDVFVEAPTQDGRMDVISANKGTRNITGTGGAGMLILHDGYRYDGVPGQADFRIVKFVEHGLRIAPAKLQVGEQGYDTLPTAQLLKQHDLEALSELEWRLSVPVSALLLVLLAVPLARTSPRQGRYGRLMVAVLAYVIYANLVGIARVWLQKGVMPAGIGIWWVHGLLLVATLILLYQQYGLHSLFGSRKVDPV